MDNNLKKLRKILIRETEKAITEMIELKTCSHSINVINGGRALTVLLLITPSRLDYPVYEALKPIIEADGKVGTLVEPNPRVPRE